MKGDRRFIPSVPKLSGHKAAPLRTLYRILAVRYSSLSSQDGRSAWLRTLRRLAGYRHRSEWSLRSLVERVLAEPMADTLLKVAVLVPCNERLGQALCDALPGLQEAVVIPSLPDPSAMNMYLGMAAAQVFGPRLRAGQGIGFSGGRAVASLANALSLPLQKGSPVRLYALTRFRGQEVLGITAEGVVAELVTRHLWQNLGEIPLPQECPVLALLDPTQVSPTDLDWAFVGLGALLAGEVLVEFPAACGFDWEWAQRMGVVAELLFHPFCADGLPPSRPPRWLSRVDTVPLTVLQTMVRANKPVIVLAGGKEKAPALLAVYRAQRAGGLLFNRLVTDEDCARELLRLLDGDVASLPPYSQRLAHRDNGWGRTCQRFVAVHWRFVARERCRQVKAVATRMGVSRNTASKLLREALQGTPPMVRVEVHAPLPEPPSLLDAEMALVRQFGLQEARVVLPLRDEWAYPSIGTAAAQLLLELLEKREQATVGLGSGRVRAVLEALNLAHALKVLPRLSHLNVWVLENTPSDRWSLALSGSAIANSLMLRCFGLPEGERLWVRLYDGTSLPDMDIVLVEIGGMYRPETPMFERALRWWGLTATEGEKVAGQILNRPFDDDGNPLPAGETVVAPPLEVFRAWVKAGVPVIGVCYGRDKWFTDVPRAVFAALKGGFINCLVTDASCATTLLARATGR
jgi:DNA-binding transcriptional regulator LsrR (DeoR family)